MCLGQKFFRLGLPGKPHLVVGALPSPLSNQIFSLERRNSTRTGGLLRSCELSLLTCSTFVLLNLQMREDLTRLPEPAILGLVIKA